MSLAKFSIAPMPWDQAKKRKPSKGTNRKARGKKPTYADAGRLARRTAEFLQDHEWNQGMLERKTPGQKVVGYSKTRGHIFAPIEANAVCLSGAINKTFCGNANLHRARVEQIPLLNLTHHLLDEFLGVSIESWNDLKAKSKEDVIEQLLKFADEYDPKRI